MAATLSWNPVRALVAPPAETETRLPSATRSTGKLRNAPRRKKASVQINEPTPEEMPAIDVGLMNGVEPLDEVRRARGEKKKEEIEGRARVGA